MYAPCLQLPLWYDMWWDNGVFPGQPAVDYMFGPLPSNLSEASSLLSTCKYQHAVPCVCPRMHISNAMPMHAPCMHACPLQKWYAKAWGVFAVFMGVPIWYHYSNVDEFRHPFVSIEELRGSALLRSLSAMQQVTVSVPYSLEAVLPGMALCCTSGRITLHHRTHPTVAIHTACNG